MLLVFLYYVLEYFLPYTLGTYPPAVIKKVFHALRGVNTDIPGEASVYCVVMVWITKSFALVCKHHRT